MAKYRPSLFFNLGSIVLIAGLVFLTAWLNASVAFKGGKVWLPTGPMEVLPFLSELKQLVVENAIPSTTAWLWYIGWFALQVFCQVALPGKVVKGQPLPDGSRLPYQMNGIPSILVTAGALAALHFLNIAPITIVSDLYFEIAAVSLAFSVIISTLLFLFPEGPKTADPMSPFSFWFGRELNPRWWGLDMKCFCESRPGLLLWVVVNISTCVKQYETHGQVSHAMLLVSLMQGLYVLDCFVLEDAILTTMDIISEHFGFMLCFGDLTWVPFTYALQNRVLFYADPSHDIARPTQFLLLALFLGGYTVFRFTNLQKHQFRRDPSNPRFKGQYLETRAGRRLLYKGWWGYARHFNYTGDLTMGWAWSLPTGWNSIFAYFYPIYFSILLLNRDRRDDWHCRQKHGNEWDKYCKLVPYRMIPYVY